MYYVRWLRISAVSVALWLAAAPGNAQQPCVPAPQIEEKAMSTLMRAAEFLAKAQRFSVTTDIEYDVMQDSGQKLDPGSFVAHAYANRHYMHTETSKDGSPVLKKKKLAPRWIEWEHRHELAGITYSPGKPQIFDNRWNAWPGARISRRRR